MILQMSLGFEKSHVQWSSIFHVKEQKIQPDGRIGRNVAATPLLKFIALDDSVRVFFLFHVHGHHTLSYAPVAVGVQKSLLFYQNNIKKINENGK